ncbi:MAG: hypothetical protein QOI57_2577 [Rubrobacteraceae bacterium]|nr:hypothetical protein [Rubrobacteraceae bacterium]
MVSEDNFPGKNNISVEVADDATVIGYPRSYYDQFSMFPIVKSGVIARNATGTLGPRVAQSSGVADTA